MSEPIPRFNIYGSADYVENGSLVSYEDHKEVVRLIENELLEDHEALLKASQARIKLVEDKYRNLVTRSDKQINKLQAEVDRLKEALGSAISQGDFTPDMEEFLNNELKD